jgi:hypothetical protein
VRAIENGHPGEPLGRLERPREGRHGRPDRRLRGGDRLRPAAPRFNWATGAKTGAAKLGGVTLVGLTALFCTASVVFALIAMADKPSAKKPAKKTAAALIHAPTDSGRATPSTA